jgi:hypothetical protein
MVEKESRKPLSRLIALCVAGVGVGALLVSVAGYLAVVVPQRAAEEQALVEIDELRQDLKDARSENETLSADLSLQAADSIGDATDLISAQFDCVLLLGAEMEYSNTLYEVLSEIVDEVDLYNNSRQDIVNLEFLIDGRNTAVDAAADALDTFTANAGEISCLPSY